MRSTRIGLITLVCGLLAAGQGSAARAQGQNLADHVFLREQMVKNEIIGAGVKDERVINSVRKTLRHEFVPPRERPLAYFDMALPIGEGQTISPPFIVAYMTEQLEPQAGDKVLEIGTGSGYQAAVLSPLVKEVYSIEIVEPLGRQAAAVLKRLGYKNVFTKVGDGYQGWPEKAPFDKIIVTCSPEKVPQPLQDQLREGGRLIVPLGERYQQMFYLFRKENGKLVSEALRPTLFVPMTGKAESMREVQPDAKNPKLVNGGFEETYVDGEETVPKNWHYVRQAKLTADGTVPEGKQYLLFKNETPGRGSQALQGFAVDGRAVRTLDVQFHVRGTDIRPGSLQTELPTVWVTFYDERQDILGSKPIGPWHGTFDWQLEKTQLDVPLKARTAIIRIGLLGAVGEVALDGFVIGPAGGKR